MPDRPEELSFSPPFMSVSCCWCFLFMLHWKHFFPLYDLYNLKENELLHSSPIKLSRWRWNITAKLVSLLYANLLVTPQGIKYCKVQIGHYKHKTVNYLASFMLYRNTVVNCSQGLAFDSALLPVRAFHITHHTPWQRHHRLVVSLNLWHGSLKKPINRHHRWLPVLNNQMYFVFRC